VHNLAIDPKDENYFISAGPPGDPVVSVWDRRMAPKSSPQTPSSESGAQGPVLEIKPAVDNSHGSTIWSLRFSGQKRGCFGVLSNTGEIKMIELGQYATKSTLNTPPTNQHGGTPWDSRHYTKRSHNLTHPWYDPFNGQEEKSRVIAYDFMPAPGGSTDLSVLALHPNRDIELLKIPELPRLLNVSALDELYFERNRRNPLGPRYDNPTSARDLELLQNRAKDSDGVRRRSEQALLESTARLDMLSIENFGHKAPPSYETPLHPSSGDQHQDLLCLWFPNYKPNVGDALKLLRTQRRRCNEGYLLNAQLNKDVIANDPWLVDMWDIVKRFEDMAKNNEMVACKLDLSYLGIYAIWNHTFGVSRNRILDIDPLTTSRFINAVVSVITTKGYPVFQGHPTKFPAQRQVCLAICGWTFSEDRLRSYCRRLIEHDEYYKAVVIAVMRGFKGLAQELLRTAIQQKKIFNIGLSAVIACETVGEEQRELCEWMAEETDDPYLKALLNYFIKGDWKIVADMPQLALSDRVGVALKYLDDKRLGEFIKIRTAEAKVKGNTEGLVLTGLTDEAIELFSNYITKFNDLQTAVLAMSFTCPLYVDDKRFVLWQDTYDMQLQTWRAFDERNKYFEAHALRAKSREKKQFGGLDEHPATLRCAHCLQSLALRTLEKYPDGSLVAVPAPRSKENDKWMRLPSGKGGQLCPRCVRRTPSCGICGLQLANPDPRGLRSGAAKKLAEEDPIARQPMHCMTCTHSFHGNHGRDWFARHKTCPVPDCRCMCALLH
jgi:WD repeat-containing protein mio